MIVIVLSIVLKGSRRPTDTHTVKHFKRLGFGGECPQDMISLTLQSLDPHVEGSCLKDEDICGSLEG